MAVDLTAMNFRFSGVAATGDSQPDPNDSLGSFRASNSPYAAGTLIVGQTALHLQIYFGAADMPVGSWVTFLTGNNAGASRRVAAELGGTVAYFTDPWPALSAIGDSYRVSDETDLFNDGPTIAECGAGVVDHRGLYFFNESGERLDDLRFYLMPLNPTTIPLDIVVGDRPISTPFDNFAGISVDTDDPPLTFTGGGGSFSTTVQEFRRPRNFASTLDTPSSGVGSSFNLNNFNAVAIWVKRNVLAQTRKGDSVTWALVAEAADGQTTPGPHVSIMTISSAPAGFTPDLSTAFDRTPRTFGGARVTGTLLDLTTQLPVIGVPMEFSLVAPSPGSLATPTPADYTDDDGQAVVQYTGSEDEADVGDDVEVQTKIGGDV